MTCKDCMHYEVCNALDESGQVKILVPSQCGCFKDKSKYIELPCEVGDTVHIIDPFNGICDMTLRNVRVNDVLKNNIFLTKSEAEQKLKELNNER